MHTAPRSDLRGEDVGPNDVKRLVTKSGNRLQLSDKPGFEAVVLATPHNNQITLTEKADGTGRTNITIESKTGDIVLHAPQGRVHIESLFYSKDIGPGAVAEPALPPPPVAAAAVSAPAAPEHAGGVAGFASGLFDSTLRPLGHMVMHPLDTAKGIGHAIAHLPTTVEAVSHAVGENVKSMQNGDTYAVGTAIGTVGTLFVPGAGEAAGLEDAAKLGKLGEVAEVSVATTRVTTGTEALTDAEKVVAARERQAAMLKDNIGYNISPSSWNQYPTIGLDGTYISDQQGVMKYFEDITGKGETAVSSETATQIEQEMGLKPGSLQEGFKVRQVNGITDLAPQSPLTGNSFFLGPGNHLPGGAPEMVINSIPTTDSEAVQTILNVRVGSK